MRLRQIYIFIVMTLAGLAVQAVLASPATATTYETQGIATSTNLLSGSSASSITNFHYNIATLPATSSVRIQFSKDSANWYSSGGTPGGWDTLVLGQADLSLAAFVAASSWTNGNSFYYKLEINSTADLSATPTIDDIRLDYTPTSGYENMFVFDNFGNVGIGTTSPSGKLNIHGAGTGTGVNTQWADSTGAAKVSILDNGNVGIGTTNPGYKLEVNTGTASGYVVTATGAWGNTSDERLKKNINPLGSALDQVLALNPVTYNLKTESNSDPAHMGFIAQEMEKITPDLVTEGPNGYKGISYAMLTPMLTKAIQEQQGIIIQEQAKNTQQDTQIADVNLKTSQNVETVGQLQKSVDDNLSVISSNFSAVDTKLALHDSQMAVVNSQLVDLSKQVSDLSAEKAGIDVQLADLAAKYTTLDAGMSLSEAEKTDLETRLTAAESSLVENQHDLITFEKGTNDTLSSMLDTEDMLTSRVLDHEDRIKVLEEKLATATITAGGEIPTNVVTQDASGNVTLAGLFKAKQVEANGVVAGSVTVKNEKEGVAPTMGDGEIKPVPVDADSDGIDDVTKKPVVPSDGKTAEINTKAVSETAKVFVTFENDPGSRYWVEKVQDGATKEYTGFILKLSEIAKSGAKFSWWIVEEK